MMEREFVSKKLKEYQIKEFIDKKLDNVGHSHTVTEETPLGEKITIYASRPGLVVGRRGSNVKELTEDLKEKFDLENPQIEVNEIEEEHLDANIVAEKIVSSLERFGPTRFKGVGHGTARKVMDAGARGVEIVIKGKVPGSRSRSWRFYRGYVKKCGEAARQAVKESTKEAKLKPGTVGVKVRIMPPGITLPDDVELAEEVEEITEEDDEEKSEGSETDEETEEDESTEETEKEPEDDIEDTEEKDEEKQENEEETNEK